MEEIYQDNFEYDQDMPSFYGEYAYNPWRRFFARGLDLTLYSTVISLICLLVLKWNIVGERSDGYSLAINILAAITMFFLEPLLINKFKTTFGKFIFGLSITRLDGSNLTYSEALNRTWDVIRYGEGFFIPIYVFIRNYKSYKTCKDKEKLSWDEYLSYRIKDTKGWRVAVFLVSHAVFFALTTLVAAIVVTIPPNRGDLTTEQFVENFNHYSNFHDFDATLDNDGNITYETKEGMYDIFMPYNNADLSISYQMQGDYVQSATFVAEKENISGFESTYPDIRILMSLALINAGDETTLFSRTVENVGNHIVRSQLKSDEFILHGHRLTTVWELTGFDDTSMDGMNAIGVKEDDNYYFMKFTIST